MLFISVGDICKAAYSQGVASRDFALKATLQGCLGWLPSRFGVGWRQMGGFKEI